MRYYIVVAVVVVVFFSRRKRIMERYKGGKRDELRTCGRRRLYAFLHPNLEILKKQKGWTMYKILYIFLYFSINLGGVENSLAGEAMRVDGGFEKTVTK